MLFCWVESQQNMLSIWLSFKVAFFEIVIISRVNEQIIDKLSHLQMFYTSN